MDRWFEYKGSPTYYVLFVMLITISVLGITSSEISGLKFDVGNNTYGVRNVTYLQWTEGGTTANLGENCTVQCSVHNAECTRQVCRCKIGYQEIQRKERYSYCAFITGGTTANLGENCSYSIQCSDHKAECTRQVCRCKIGYQEIQREERYSYCAFITAKTNKTQELFKAAMVALACFILVIIGIFLMFIFNRSIQRDRLNVLERAGSNRSDSREDIFSVCDQMARERLSDKPPTYEDVALTDQQVLGMPPPIYSASEQESLFSNAASATRLYPSSNAVSTSRLYPSTNGSSDTGPFSSSNEAIACEQLPSLNAASAAVHFLSTNEANASDQSSSLNAAGATGGHFSFSNEAFVSDQPPCYKTFPSSNEANASEQSLSLNPASATKHFPSQM